MPPGRMPTGPVERSIAMWGPPGSGKTTFLAALSIALTRSPHLGWTIMGGDEASERRLIQMTHELAGSRSFPRPTDGVEYYNWVLSGPGRAGRKRLFRKKLPDESIRVKLDLIDPKGELVGLKLDSSQRAELVDSLVKSKGIIYIFDPTREFDKGDAYDHTFGMLVQLTRRLYEETGDGYGKLPHHLAVCVTKFDELPVHETAEKLGLVVHSDDRHEFPRVEGEDARELFTRLCAISGSGNAEMVLNLLEQYFEPERIKYFVTSAIGFYVDQGGIYDRDDPANLLPIDGADSERVARRSRIRGPVHPINVIEPVFWLISQVMNSSDGNGALS